MYTIHVDNPLTRRMRLHIITHDQRGVCFTSAKIGPCLDWLYDNDIDQVKVVTEARLEDVSVFELTLEKLNPGGADHG